jgi:hypothetical protein
VNSVLSKENEVDYLKIKLCINSEAIFLTIMERDKIAIDRRPDPVV